MLYILKQVNVNVNNAIYFSYYENIKQIIERFVTN